MSQTTVTNFYSTRKRLKDPIKDSKSPVISNSIKGKPVKGKTKSKIVNKLNNYWKSESDANKIKDKNETLQEEKVEIPRTPKRNLSSPDELTPSKKKSLASLEATISETVTPKKHYPDARRKLHSNSPNRCLSPKKIAISNKQHVSPAKAATYENMSNENLASLLNESRSKILFSGRLDELKKSLAKFSSVSAKTKEFQANAFKITSVVSSSKNSDSPVEPTPIIQGEPAYKKYSYLAAPESKSLILPYKYKLLAETFRCVDTVVSMMNNRKEKITFEKIQNGVQEMMKKKFLKNHLGQIMTVLPEAYSLQYEKNDSYAIDRNKLYQLVITPMFVLNGDSTESEMSSSKQKKNNQSAFIHMTPQLMLERKKQFHHNLIEVVKKYHQAFLTKLNFPAVSDKSIVRWHPKFAVDSVPDIPVAPLPEEPETKVCTARDLLNKITFRGKIEKALQSVAQEHAVESKEETAAKDNSKNTTHNKKESSALKGICTDLLEKIRARESAKLIETMTRSVQDEKRTAMMERIPKIAHILWHYFIAERKAAVAVDLAVDKIIHSFNSLTTPEEVKEHLQLITETMPGWLSFIKIPKGEYITMDKRKDINVMLDNLK